MKAPFLIKEIATSSEEVPYELLLLADPSRSQIESYLSTSKCFILKTNSETIGVLILNEINQSTIEIKNIAVTKSYQRKGIGKELLKFATKASIDMGYQTLVIGTGNSSIFQLELYQNQGFLIKKTIKDFFVKNYSEPIFENGIQCKDLIVLEKKLKN